MTPLVEATSKVIDLRECEKPEFRHIWEELERIAWEIQGWPANRLMLLFGKAKVSMPIWSRRWEYPWAIISADIQAGQVVLDAGCGNAPLLPFLSRHGLKCFGVDKGVEHKNWRWRLAEHLGYVDIQGSSKRVVRRYKIAFRRESITQMSFADGFFDRVFCISVLEHLPPRDRLKAVAEMARVLKPGGRLIVTMDLPRDEPHAADSIVEASGLCLLGGLDHSIDRSLRHGHTYEIGGLVLDK